MEPSFLLPRTRRGSETIADRTRGLLELSLYLNSLDPEHPWEVRVRPWARARSEAQNRTLFRAYDILSEATGFTKDELHDVFCRRFFGTVDREFAGVKTSRPLRTTTRDEMGSRDVLKAVAFSDFYAMVEQVAAEAGVVIPPPLP